MNKWFFTHISPCLEKALGKLGVRGLASLGSFLGSLLWFLLPARRKLATKAVEKHLQMPPEQAVKIAKQSFQHNLRSFAELFLVPSVNEKFIAQRIQIMNPENWEALKNSPVPVVATTAHLGAWEILAGVSGTDLPKTKGRAIVVRTQRNQEVSNRIMALRGSTGATLLGHRNAAPQVLRLLKRENAIVSFLVDHNCNRREAIFLPFLNEVAAVNVGPALLAVRAGAAIWPIFLLHDGENYKYYIEKPLYTAELTGNRDEQVQQAAIYYTEAVEKYVRLFPEQWFWMHKRWKTRPEAESGGEAPANVI